MIYGDRSPLLSYIHGHFVLLFLLRSHAPGCDDQKSGGEGPGPSPQTPMGPSAPWWVSPWVIPSMGVAGTLALLLTVLGAAWCVWI